MNRGIVIIILVFLFGCVNKHPYPYKMESGLNNIARVGTEWCLVPLSKDSNLDISEDRLTLLTKSIDQYLKKCNLNTRMADPLTDKSDMGISARNYCNDAVIIPKIIKTVANMDGNIAGWHGVSESGVDFWSHFSPSHNITALSGRVKAASLYVEIYSDGVKCYENAGGIELLERFNKYSMRSTPKSDLLTDDGNFLRAMEIAFKQLIDKIK